MAGGSRQVFISYARSDAVRVDELVEGLRQLHYDAWVDKELTGGQAWWDTVLSQIRVSSTVLVAVSPAALESVAVRREYEYAHAVGRPLIPVVVDRVQLETLPPLLAQLQVVDYRQPDTMSAFALAAALTTLPTPQALPRPLPEPPPIPVSYLSGLKEQAQAATLSMDEQLALVARLKVALGRVSEREAAEEVLRSLQNRHDLYQVSAREIESLLSPSNRQVPEPQPQDAARVSRPDSSDGSKQAAEPAASPTDEENLARLERLLPGLDRYTVLELKRVLDSLQWKDTTYLPQLIFRLADEEPILTREAVNRIPRAVLVEIDSEWRKAFGFPFRNSKMVGRDTKFSRRYGWQGGGLSASANTLRLGETLLAERLRQEGLK
jgi:hypothetical protein